MAQRPIDALAGGLPAGTVLRHGAIRAAVVLALALVVSSTRALAGPAVGEPAPAFSLAGTDGRTYTLEGVLEDHEGLVLAWFPKAFTPG